ncbi:hypothetical protein [Nannocystis pusilla]|uniref:hypothetical protein n=1 Tax=Nannocystis pusilla TaxID=889268 RepID=UPI003DA3621E
MRLISTYGGPSLVVALLAACPSKDDGDSATEPSPATDSDGGEPTGSPTQSTEGPTTTASATEPTETSSPGTETSDPGTETAAETGTDTEGESVVCPEPDPAVDATFAVTFTDWPDNSDESHFIDVLCTIDAVTLEAGMVVTALTCDDAGVPRALGVSIRAAPDGDVTWAAGDSVQLDSFATGYDVLNLTRGVTMRTPDRQELLLVAVAGAEEADAPTRFAPLLYEIQELCTPPDWGSDSGAVATVGLGIPRGDVLVLDSGQRGDLALDSERHYAVDLEQAIVGECCHGNDRLKLLVRRVHTGG